MFVKIGMRVVPFKKSVISNIEDSVVWNEAQKIGQKYLYVINIEYHRVVLNIYKKDVTGDFYLADDFCDFDTRENKLKRILKSNIK